MIAPIQRSTTSNALTGNGSILRRTHHDTTLCPVETLLLDTRIPRTFPAWLQGHMSAVRPGRRMPSAGPDHGTARLLVQEVRDLLITWPLRSNGTEKYDKTMNKLYYS